MEMVRKPKAGGLTEPNVASIAIDALIRFRLRSMRQAEAAFEKLGWRVPTSH